MTTDTPEANSLEEKLREIRFVHICNRRNGEGFVVSSKDGNARIVDTEHESAAAALRRAAELFDVGAEATTPSDDIDDLILRARHAWESERPTLPPKGASKDIIEACRASYGFHNRRLARIEKQLAALETLAGYCRLAMTTAQTKAEEHKKKANREARA